MRTPKLWRSSSFAGLFCALTAAGSGYSAYAQAPTSLSYPANNVFIANVSNVYLSPNLAGSAASYTISPALPSGLTFNTNTGVISGVPMVASAATTYTITAVGSNAAQTSVTTSSIMVTNNFFNNNYSSINFGGSGVTLIHGSTGATLPSTNTPGTGTAANDIVVYRNVATLSGQAIDCIVKTVAVTSGTTFSAYDQDAVSNGAQFNSNDPRFFSPQVGFPTGAGGGSMQFNFQFILGGTYSTVTKTGSNVVLQNVKINTYDIDGNGTGSSNQYNEFGGFTSSEISNGTSLQAPVFNTTTGLTTYRSNIATNSQTVTTDTTRVRINYNNISDFSIRMGGLGTAYFFLDFSTGPAFNTADTTVAPSIDLNTLLAGVNNNGSGCGVSLPFTPATQTNVSTSGNITQLSVSFPTADIVNGASERLLVNNATSGGTISLNTDPSGTVVLSGNSYTLTSSTTANVRTLVFTKASFTQAQAEQLLDALMYSNSAAVPTSGSRNFKVNIRNTAYQSPDAVFTATLNCVSISGNVFHDVNGLNDLTVNASGSAGQFAANAVYVVRVDPVTNLVIDAQPIAAGGAYTFGTVTPGAYNLFVSNSNPAAGTSFTAATYPTGGYAASGENLGAAAGTDLLADGKLVVTIGSESITNANFGLQIPPTTTANTINGIANPGGFNAYAIPNNSFIIADADGLVDSMRINSFPTGAHYIRIGTTVYTNGGACPPQVTSCTPWPGTVTVPCSGGNPIPTISVDPTADGTTAVVINYTAIDNGRATSGASNLTINFTGSSNYTLSGVVWNDANSDGLQTSESTLAPAGSGQTLYAVLIQLNHTYSGSGTILASVPVNATTGYSFANVPSASDFVIRLVSQASAPVNGAAATTLTPNLPQPWIAVSTVTDGVIANTLNTNDPVISLPNLTSGKANLNFGLERLPDATDLTTPVSLPVIGTRFTLNGVGSNQPIPPATDPEDGVMAAGKAFIAVSLPTNTTLRYNNIPVTVGQVITNFDPSLLQVEVTSATVATSLTSFQFNYRDAAGKVDPTPATYTLTWGVNLSVQLMNFSAKQAGSDVQLDWTTVSETNNIGFTIERSADARSWKAIGSVASAAVNGNSHEKLQYNFLDEQPANGSNYYRLRTTDAAQKLSYSDVQEVMMGRNGEVSIYPNPATDRVLVSGIDADKATVRIFDMSGRLVLKTVYSSQGISVQPLPAGMYTLELSGTGTEIYRFKLTKNQE